MIQTFKPKDKCDLARWLKSHVGYLIRLNGGYGDYPFLSKNRLPACHFDKWSLLMGASLDREAVGCPVNVNVVKDNFVKTWKIYQNDWSHQVFDVTGLETNLAYMEAIEFISP